MNALLHLPEIDATQFEVGPVDVTEGGIVEVSLPRGWTPSDDTSLREAWAAMASKQGATIAWAEPLHLPRAVLIMQLFPKRLAVEACVVRQAGLARGVAQSICRSAGVDAASSVTSLDWTTRKIIGFEIACAKARVVVIDDVGLDPLGERRFVEHLRHRAGAAGAGLIALRPDDRVVASPWAESRVTARLRGEAAT